MSDRLHAFGEAFLTILIWFLVAMAVISLPGCPSARAARLSALEATATAVGTAGDLVHRAAAEDVAASCATAEDIPACGDRVYLERWRDADTALGALRLALGGWLVAEQMGDPSTFPETYRAIIGFWADLTELVGSRVDLPALTLRGFDGN